MLRWCCQGAPEREGEKIISPEFCVHIQPPNVISTELSSYVKAFYPEQNYSATHRKDNTTPDFEGESDVKGKGERCAGNESSFGSANPHASCHTPPPQHLAERARCAATTVCDALCLHLHPHRGAPVTAPIAGE